MIDKNIPSPIFSRPRHKCCRSSKGCAGKAVFVLGIVAGAAYGFLFAKTSGSELRAKLKKSETPLLDFWSALEETKLDVIATIKEKFREWNKK